MCAYFWLMLKVAQSLLKMKEPFQIFKWGLIFSFFSAAKLGETFFLSGLENYGETGLFIPRREF